MLILKGIYSILGNLQVFIKETIRCITVIYKYVLGVVLSP